VLHRIQQTALDVQKVPLAPHGVGAGVVGGVVLLVDPEEPSTSRAGRLFPLLSKRAWFSHADEKFLLVIQSPTQYTIPNP
jgi:hypothetical protein